MKTQIFIVVLMVLLSACAHEDNSKTVPKDLEELNKNVSTEVVSLQEFFTAYISEELEIAEVQFKPVMKQPQKYMGVSLQKILTEIYGQKILDSLELSHAIELICKDGYCPQMKLVDAWRHEGYVVDRMVGEPEKWPAGAHAKYAPYYLVWSDEKNNRKVPWPYGLVSVRLVNLEKERACLLPVEDELAEKGVDLFKKYCMKCHSLNGLGGTMGPELNYPQNILSYWREDQLYAFVKNPQSFRYDNKMKPVKKITEKEMELIIEYLKSIKNYNFLCE